MDPKDTDREDPDAASRRLGRTSIKQYTYDTMSDHLGVEDHQLLLLPNKLLNHVLSFLNTLDAGRSNEGSADFQRMSPSRRTDVQ
jgi:hypothetical protein